MTWLIALLSLAVGIALGYRLPALRAWWRRYRERRNFKPVALRPYRPAAASRSDRGPSAS
jgi:hypothetical protein